MNKQRLVRTSVFVGRDQLEDLKRISNQSSIPVAVLFRGALDHFLAAVPREPDPRWAALLGRADIHAGRAEAGSESAPAAGAP